MKEIYRSLARYVRRNTGGRLEGFSQPSPNLDRRFCKRVNGELLRALSDDSRDAYEQYLAAYKLMHKRDKEIASAFDDFRRSTAIVQIAIIRKLGVITDEELGRFSESTRASLQFFWD